MLETFVGNREIKETIESFVKSGRFPHAVLIEGEPGSGRKALARILAAAAVCRDEAAPCGHCRECELIKRDGHTDVLTYGPEKKKTVFSVDLVRKVCDDAAVMPIEAARKVLLLTDCEKMNEPAQNALLKTLEEPPSFAVFILICRNASSLLPTVRSRCVTLSVENPEPEEALTYLKATTGKADDLIAEALEAAHGNLGRAMRILSGETAAAAESAKAFLQTIADRDRLAALQIVYKLEKDRPGFLAFLSELSLLLKSDLKSGAVGKRSILPERTAAAVSELVDRTETTLKKHIGEPLSLPLLGASLCAEIFVIV